MQSRGPHRLRLLLAAMPLLAGVYEAYGAVSPGLHSIFFVELAFPKWFGAENVNGSPANALLATTVLIQLFLILSFFSKNAYQFFYFIASVAILPPYVLSGAYALKLALSGEGYGADDRSRNWDILVGALATVYGVWLVYAAGLNFLLMCTILFAPGILVYAQARRERGEAVFEGFEAVLAILIVLLAVVAAYLMWTGKISPL